MSNAAATPPPKAKRRFRLSRPKFRLGPNAIIIASCAVVILALAGLSGFLYWQNKQLKDDPAAPAVAAAITEKVSKLYAIPRNEQPTVATIEDVSQLKGQPFFKGAQNGDAVLVFAKAKFAILYREKENRIINTGPVYNEDENKAANGTSAKPPATEPVKTEQ